MRIFPLLIALSLSISSSIASANGTALQSFADVVEPLAPAVVNVYTTQHKKPKRMHKILPHGTPPMDPLQELLEQMPFGFSDVYPNHTKVSLGSGFIIDSSGYIVTNHHIVDGADEIRVKLNDQTEIEAKLVGTDQRTDVALLKVEHKKPLPHVKFGDSDKARVGDWVIAIGNPFGLGGTVTAGIISYKGRDIPIDESGIVDNFIQTDAAINSGNSGGPMFNTNGEVIGVNTAIVSPYGGGANIGLGFAIPSSTVTHIVEQLKAHGKINRGLLNIKIQEVTDDIAEALGLEEANGAFVAEVDSSGSGAKAGLKPGDIIIEFNGQAIKHPRKLRIAVAEAPVGSEVKVVVLRDGKKHELKGKIAAEDIATIATEEKSDTKIKRDKDVGTIEKHGITFSNISPEIVKSLGIDANTKGVVVTESKDTKTQWYGLEIGDIVTGVNQQSITNVSDFEKAYSAAKAKDRKNIVLLVKRRGLTLFVALPL